jgi:hypothetical protein
VIAALSGSMNSMSVEFWNAAHSACGGYLAGRIRAWWISRAPGSAGRKKPLPVVFLRRGPQRTRRLDIFPHGALRSREAYPLQRSS